MPAVQVALPWLLGAVALVLAIVRTVRIYRMIVHLEAFASVVRRLLAAGSFDRVDKICKVIPETALGAAVGATNAVAMQLKNKERATDEEIRVALRAAYEPAFDAAVRPIFETRWMAVVSFVAGLAAIGLAETADPTAHVPAIVGALAVLGVLANVRGSTKVIAGAKVLDEILPTYVEAIRGKIVKTTDAPKAMPEPPKDDPKSWSERLSSLLYGFDTRSPDLFFEIVVLPFAKEIESLRVAKLRRSNGARPRYVVAIFGDDDDLRRFRDRVEIESASRYERCASPASEIAPDATYGAETRTRTEVLDELREGKLDVVAKS